jgi:prolyl-tRNA synthetase
MRVSKLFGETLRDAPADVDIESHQLLLRAGYVRQLAAGIFSYLPLAQRALRKLETIIRQEMDAIGAQELTMPIVHPAELWQQTGRWDAIDDTMARFQDRRGRAMLLAMTHEEVVAELARSEINSYRQLPQLVYQIQTKFRDEPRPRGGLIRTREFTMKDSYSLDRDERGLQHQYMAHYDAYHRIFARASLPVIAVGSDVGMMGGKEAHEFMYLTPIGEDTLVLCATCGYAANQEVARFRKDPLNGGAPQPVERVHTPGASTIADLAAFLALDPRQTAKVVFFTGEYADQATKLIVALVRGDMDVNQTAVLNLSGARMLRPATAEEITAVGAVPGFASPVGIDRTNALVIIDDLVAQSPNLVAGANEGEYHLLNTNAGRDYQPDVVGAIAQAYEGAPCSVCGSALHLQRGVEVGNIFQLGTRYTAALGASYTDEHGVPQPIVMGSYGIGVGRLLACVAEEHHDERGLVLPLAVAPYHVALVALARKPETYARAEQLYRDLQHAGVEVLYDDRDASPGIKFADADLQGLPLRITIGDRSLANGTIEIKRRTANEATLVPVADAVGAIRAEIDALEAEEHARLANTQVWQHNEPQD